MLRIFVLFMYFMTAGCSTVYSIEEKEFPSQVKPIFLPISVLIDDGTKGSQNAYPYDAEIYKEMLGFEIVQLGPKRMLTRLNSVAVIDIIETDTEIRDHKMRNHIGFKVIHKVNGRHGSYGFNFSDFDNNAWQIEDYPRGGYFLDV